MSIEAMKQALEALELVLETDTKPKHEISKSITSLRQAIEQAEKQEPVAWPIETNNQVEALAKHCGWDNRRYMTPADYQIWCDRMRGFVQLATPPHRKPLTDEEIDKLPWGPHEGNPMTFAEGLRDFARAIEAAHGIKE